MSTENKETGASAIELAIVLPLLVIILVGIIEFGFIMFDKAVITNASREGARKGIVFRQPEICNFSEITTQVETAAKNYGVTHLVSLGDGAGSPPSVLLKGDCCIPGSDVRVTVTYPYKFLVLPKFGFLPPEIMLTGVTVMNCENQVEKTSSPVAP